MFLFTRAEMNGKRDITNLEQMVERLAKASDENGRVPVSAMLGVVGHKSFGPLLVFAGLIAFSPLSGIPGVPTGVGLIVLLTAGQMLCGRTHFWLPHWLVRRTVPRRRYDQTLEFMRPVARFVDRFFRPRLTFLTRHIGAWLVAVVCVLIGMTMPPLELMPFAATAAGAALTAFGLSLIAQDGAMAVVALACTATASFFLIDAVF